MRARSVLLLAVVAAIVAPIRPAFGTFTAHSSSPSMTVSTAVLVAPGTASAANGACVIATSRTVEISWSQTSSSFADGYVVLRATSSSGPYSIVSTIMSRLTTTWADVGVAASTTYYYRVQATKSAWRSQSSPTASVTTPTSLCLV